ncbi:MAG: hypothetical protein AABZ53_14345 [Planctomycetota bacterium]
MLTLLLKDLPPDHPALQDFFRPPDDPVLCRCLHCGQECLSSLIEWRQHGNDPTEGMWWCPYEGCDGKGFEFDLHPVDGEMWDEGPDEESTDEPD